MESVSMALENAAQFWDLDGKIRRGRGREAGAATHHPCKDGFVMIVAIMGRNKVMWEPFVQWMKDEGVEEWEVFNDDKWIDENYRSSPEGYELFCRIFERFTMQKDKLYLYERGQAHRVAISPVADGKDILENPQLEHRNFWKTMYHDNLKGEVTYPGAPYELENSEWRLGNPAPVLGQHTAEILSETGYDAHEIEALVREEVVYVG